MDKNERKLLEKDQRRNRIIDHAQKIFFEKGYESATVDDIAVAAGYSLRTIYMYFRDREELFLSVVLRGQKIFFEMLKSAGREGGGDQVSVFQLGRAFYEFSINHPEFFSFLMIYESKIHVYHGSIDIEVTDDIRARCRNISNQYGELVIAAIDCDLKAGRIKSRLKPKQLMLILWGQIFGIMQIILMRKKMFRDAYGITHEELFEEFLVLTGRGLN